MSKSGTRPVRLALAALALVVVGALGVSASAFGRSDASRMPLPPGASLCREISAGGGSAAPEGNGSPRQLLDLLRTL